MKFRNIEHVSKEAACFPQDGDVSLSRPRACVQSGLQRGPTSRVVRALLRSLELAFVTVVGFCKCDDEICRAERFETFLQVKTKPDAKLTR